MTDTVTILTCCTPDAQATKKFSKMTDGTIIQENYNAGKYFTHEERQVSCLSDIASLFDDLMNKPLCFAIRGKALPNAGQVVRRMIHGKGAAFEMQARHWMMLDMDKVPCPAHLNPKEKPDEAAAWIKHSLPAPFNTASCYYKFSSSQSVMKGDTLSVHFIFWCDRPITEPEWKRFFKINPCPVDKALFSPAQIHYSAAPIFSGMNDPLSKRSGMLMGDTDTAVIPTIPQPEPTKNAIINKTPPVIGLSDIEKALALLLPFYPKQGGRERFCATVAAVLYRAGWPRENIAEFILELATAAGDDEIMKRHDNAYRVCDAIDNDRPMMGIPALKNDFAVDKLDEILALLGAGKPDIASVIETLSNVSPASEIEAAIQLLLSFSAVERDVHLEEIKRKTNIGKTVLNRILKDTQKETGSNGSRDNAVVLLEAMLHEYYKDSAHLLRTTDGNFWEYNGRHWQIAPDDLLKKRLLLLAPQIAEDNDRISGMVNAALNLLAGRVFREGDPLRFNAEPPMVINCRNGELWFDEQGKVTFKPHRPESYLRHCLDVDYNPSASSTRFDEAVLEIFSTGKDPQAMYRHFMELVGYACQPWRKLAIILLFYGGGSNGKTRLTGITENLLGQSSVMSCRISEIEKNAFKIGALANKLLLVDDDVDAGTCLPDGFLKKISEEKTMTGEHKHRDPFEFKCRALPLLLANEYPSLKDLSHGIQRRLMVIPFKRRFTTAEAKVGLFDDIWAEEASGILNRAVEGFQRLKKRGHFAEPDDCILSKQEWIARSNFLATFIDEMCDKSPNKKQPVTEFYDRFRAYGVKSWATNIPTLQGTKKRLESLGYDIGLLNGYPTVRGLYARTELEALKNRASG